MLDIHANKIIANKFVGEFENTNNNDGISIGMIIPYSGNNEIPNGFLLCNGASIRKDTYIDLFNIIGTVYGSIDEEHFNLPNLNDRFLEGANVGGKYKEAGLPNIEGTYQFQTNAITVRSANTIQDSVISGSFTVGKQIEKKALAFEDTTSSYTGYEKLIFDASLSNSIYGISDTVQPNSLTIRYIIKAFNGINHTSIVDLEVTQLANELNEFKVNNDYVIESYNDKNGNWYRLYKSGWLEQGGLPSNLIQGSSNNINTINLFKPFSNTNYTVLTKVYHNKNGQVDTHSNYADKTTTTFAVICYDPSNSYTNVEISWYACGVVGQMAEE